MLHHHSFIVPVNTASYPLTRHDEHTVPLRFDDFVYSIYLPYARFRKRSWYLDERIARQYISPVFGKYVFATIQRPDVENWLQKLLNNGLAPATCNRILAVFKTICTLAEVRGVLSTGKSPCTGITGFKLHPLRERYLSRQEAQRLMHVLTASKRLEAFALRLLLLTGARKNEILRARWEYLRLDLRLLIVPLSKSGKPRHILLSEGAEQVIRTLPRRQDCPWLFPGRDPEKPLSDLYLFWNTLRQDLGFMDVRIHDLRHTFASFLVNAGHSLYEVQTLLGHGDPRTTTRYAHLGQDSLIAAAQTVSTYIAPRRKRRKKVSNPLELLP